MMIISNHALERGERKMIVDLDSWEAGYDDGLLGRPSQCTPGLDRFSYSSGYVQARACRPGTQEDLRLRYTGSSPQRAPQRHGGSSRLIII
jgi:hypothetical protein